MRRSRQSNRATTRIDLIEWLVVTLILTVAFFAILQVVGDDLQGYASTVWETLSGALR